MSWGFRNVSSGLVLLKFCHFNPFFQKIISAILSKESEVGGDKETEIFLSGHYQNVPSKSNPNAFWQQSLPAGFQGRPRRESRGEAGRGPTLTRAWAGGEVGYPKL